MKTPTYKDGSLNKLSPGPRVRVLTVRAMLEVMGNDDREATAPLIPGIIPCINNNYIKKLQEYISLNTVNLEHKK